MKLEIEVELPKDIANGWEVVRIGQPVPGDDVLEVSRGKLEVIRWLASFWNSDIFPRIILRRKLNPREWWPQWVTADSITFGIQGQIRLHCDNGTSGYWSDATSLLDFSWIPGHLRRSGMTIANPWKGEQQ